MTTTQEYTPLVPEIPYGSMNHGTNIIIFQVDLHLKDLPPEQTRELDVLRFRHLLHYWPDQYTHDENGFRKFMGDIEELVVERKRRDGVRRRRRK